MKPSEAAKTLKQVGEDLLYLVDLFGSYKQVKKLHEYTLLERVLSEQCRVTGSGKDKKIEIKKPKDISSDSLQNPSDPDAAYDGYKGQGFQAAGIEATNSHLKSDLGAGRLRVRGMDNVRFALVLKALGLNIMRCAKAMSTSLLPYLKRILGFIAQYLAFESKPLTFKPVKPDFTY